MTIANIQTSVKNVTRGQIKAKAPNIKFSMPDMIMEPDSLCNKSFMAIIFYGIRSQAAVCGIQM
jgi:hypothetical protein